MKTLIIKIIFLAIVFFQVHHSYAQIRGNGTIITKAIDVNAFDKIHINFPVRVEVDANADYALTITTDENIFPFLVLENHALELNILQDKWIEPSQTMEVKIGTKALQYFEIGGYGNATVFNINEKSLELVNQVGKVKLSGKVDDLKFTINTGDLDASNLKTQHVNGNIWSHGEAIVYATESIEGTVKGKLIFMEKPAQLKVKIADKGEVLSTQKAADNKKIKAPVKYIDIKLRNNKFSRVHTYVEGPKNRKFSYGMPFNPKQVKKERYPVGTKLFIVNSFGVKKLLLTIEAEDEGQTLDLFSKL